MRQRTVHCYRCGKEFEVSSRTLSIGCPHCYQRLSMEDHVVSGMYHAKQLETCGSLAVGPKGDLRARLQVQTLQVEGQVHGDVRAEGKVSVGSKARLVGDIRAVRLEVSEGGRISGYVRIEPGKGGCAEKIES